MSNLRWFVGQTHGHCEKIAVRDLIARGFTVFLPMCTVRRPAKPRELLSRKQRLSGTSVLLDVPYFAGYLFVQMDLDTDVWTDVQYAEGMRSVLCSTTGWPMPVRHGVIEKLIDSTDDRHVITSSFVPLAIHAALCITEGPMIDHDGVCLWSDATRVRVLMQVLGRAVEVMLPRAAVKVA